MMPIILRILAEKSVSGDMDLTRTYLGVWCDNYGQGIVEIADERLYAETAGLRGARGVRSWRDRMAKLSDLGFLHLHQGVSRNIGFVAILHPYPAVERLRRAGLVSDAWWGAFQQRLAQVGVVQPDSDAVKNSGAEPDLIGVTDMDIMLETLMKGCKAAAIMPMKPFQNVIDFKAHVLQTLPIFRPNAEANKERQLVLLDQAVREAEAHRARGVAECLKQIKKLTL
ncbi:MAG: hypothetical protein ABR924_21120 [Terracidiphilus sp.]